VGKKEEKVREDPTSALPGQCVGGKNRDSSWVLNQGKGGKRRKNKKAGGAFLFEN